ncbi:hypothetical protein L1887_47910 [Cichorium endivia]|nr:hypothetical protein L1887_47910 [Cichorium endivia]
MPDRFALLVGTNSILSLAGQRFGGDAPTHKVQPVSIEPRQIRRAGQAHTRLKIVTELGSALDGGSVQRGKGKPKVHTSVPKLRQTLEADPYRESCSVAGLWRQPTIKFSRAGKDVAGGKRC